MMRSPFERLNAEQMRRDEPTPIPNPWFWAVVAWVAFLSLVLAHAAYGAMSEAIYQSIHTPKGW